MKEKFKIQNSKFKSFKVSIFLLFTFYFLLNQVSAQSVSASLDRDKILLGEQVTLQVNVTNVDPDSAFITSWPHINDTLNHLEIIKRTTVDTINVNQTNSYQQNFIITGFDSGKWQVGPFNFIIENKLTGKQIKLSSPIIFLTVLPVDVSAMKDYHPIKDIIEVETKFNWLPVIIGIIILVLAIIIFIILKKRKKKTAIKPAIVLEGTPLERAVKKLHKLHEQKLSSMEEIKKFHSEIDLICRQYFEEMTNVKAMQATTSELFNRMNVYMQDVKLRRKVHEIFQLNESVKFAKYMPAETESKNVLNEVINSLQQIEDITQQAKNNAQRMV